ncbi:MAG: type II toxin-antitoxin system ParD family antitoxin [Hyphomicrobiales bacterium]|nr:MAG: type II toxin-antitoxin system ParD family antitoxin [Hyphomicrobiales bacterium]
MPSSYTIGAHFEKFAKDLVASGRYASVSEVLREAMRLLERDEAEFAELRAELEEADKGPFTPWDLNDAKQEGRRLLAERRKSDAA